MELFSQLSNLSLEEEETQTRNYACPKQRKNTGGYAKRTQQWKSETM